MLLHFNIEMNVNKHVAAVARVCAYWEVLKQVFQATSGHERVSDTICLTFCERYLVLGSAY